MSDDDLDEFETKIKNLAKDKKLSDCSFLVGTDPKQLFYAHKVFLAMSSDIFRAMFLGSLKEMPIKVPDITAAGFQNLLNYKFDIPLSELYETFAAADKYLVTSFLDQFSEYVKSILNISNCCIIYDQMIKINKDKDSLDRARKMIIFNSRAAFSNEYFENISEDTLIDILNMDTLNLEEIDVLKGCSRWVNNEVKKRKLESTPDHKRKVFKSIRHLIDFSKIEANDFKSFDQIDNMLSIEEIGQLYLSQLFPDKFSLFKCEITRKKFTLFTAIDNSEWTPIANRSKRKCQ